jgi:hypothetical protein
MQVVQPGATATFSVVPLDTSGLSYQWLFSGTNLAGQTSDALQISNVGTNNQGYYSVVLANSFGNVTSSPAPLWIDSRGCGMPDWWQLYYFGNLTNNASADFDGDGVSNLQEFLDGTNPTNAASARYRFTIINLGCVVTATPTLLSYSNGATVSLSATAMPPYTFRGWGGDLSGTNNPVSLTMTNNKTVYAYAGAFTVTWTNGSSGDWNTASNWYPNIVPDPSDNVLITSAVTVSSSNSVECAGLTLGAPGFPPTLAISGNLTLDGPSYWVAGTMSGSGSTIVRPAATLTFANPNAVFLSGRTLENDGTILWAGANDISLTSAVISNAPAAVFSVQNAANLNNSASRFDNAGLFRKSGSPGTTTLAVPFNNLGSVDVQSGTLLCANLFTNSGIVSLESGATNTLSGGGSATGSFVAQPGSLAEWTGNSFTPPFTLMPGAQLSGSGLFRLDGSTVNFNTDIAVQNLDLLTTVFGTATTLNGSGTLTVSNVMNWVLATMGGTGRTIIAPGAILNVSNTFAVTLNRSLENGGTVLWTGPASIYVNNATVTNRSGALFNAQAASQLGSSGAEFDNAGIFRKSLNAGTITVFGNFNNFATVDIQAGTLSCGGGPVTNNGLFQLAPGTTNFIYGGGSASGSFNTGTGALVAWTGNTFTLIPGAQLSGPGVFRLDGSTVNFNTDIAVQNLDLLTTVGGTSTTLNGTGTLTISNVMNWVFATMGGTGRTIIAPGATLNVSNTFAVTLNRSLENGGTVLWIGPASIYVSSATVSNRPGALFNAQNAASLIGSSARFDNAGTFRKSVNPGTTSFIGLGLSNYAAIDLQAGLLALNSGFSSLPAALLNCGLGGTNAGSNYGQLQVSGSLTLNGGLSVNLEPGYLPATNDSFTVVTAGSRNSSFTSFSYPSNRVALVLSNSPSSVILNVTGVFSIPQPVLLTPQILGSNALLTWTATSNVTYRLENKGALSSTNWSAVPGDVTTLSNLASKLDPLTPSNSFYRVRVLP